MRAHSQILNTLALGALLCLPLPALAQYKCTDANGRTSYSELPCKGAAAQKQLAQPPAAAKPAPAAPAAPTMSPPPSSSSAGPAPAQKGTLSNNPKDSRFRASQAAAQPAAPRCVELKREYDHLAGPKGDGATGRETRLDVMKKEMAQQKCK